MGSRFCGFHNFWDGLCLLPVAPYDDDMSVGNATQPAMEGGQTKPVRRNPQSCRRGKLPRGAIYVVTLRGTKEGISRTAESEFQNGYFSLGEWFEGYDALHVLAYCCTYFLCHPVGVDPETNGELDFYPHYLEILQAFSLMQERSLSTRPLGPDAEELLDLMGSIGPAASIRGFKANVDQVDGESERNLVLLNMRSQTMAVRNPGYPHHIRHVALELAETVRDDFADVHAIDPVQLVESLFRLKEVEVTSRQVV